MLFQLSVAGYALRLTRIFGTARVGWSLFCAFLLLALLHGFQTASALQTGTLFEIKTEITYALVSVLLLIGLMHMETVLRQRQRHEAEEARLRAGLEAEIKKKTDHLTRAIEELQTEMDERKRVEERLRQQARLLDLAHDAIVVQDLDYRVTYWNKGAENIYGWTAREAMGKRYSDLLSVENFADGGANRTAMARGHWEGETSIRTKNGRKALVKEVWTLVYDAEGLPKSIMVVSADITETRELQDQNLRAQRLESIGTLAGGIAHDLNNVLTPILISAQLLKERVTNGDEKALLDALGANVMRGAGLVKQILALGRGFKGERVVVKPANLAREIRQFILDAFPKSIALDVQVADNLWTVMGDAIQLHQVLLNLCVNARDAMPDGGKLTLAAKNVSLDESQTSGKSEIKPGPYVVFEVTDAGAGIPREIQSKIFDPFFTTKEQGRGTGLGLSTSFTIVKHHGGFINFHSEPGMGSTFRVYLPADVNQAEAMHSPASPADARPGAGELVLIVEDEQVIRELAQMTLQSHGYRTVTAANGAEAVSVYQARQREISVVLMDMFMPVMDGPAAINAIKSINNRALIIGTSGLLTAGDEKSGTSLVHFVPKPYTADSLFQALHTVLHSPPARAVTGSKSGSAGAPRFTPA